MAQPLRNSRPIIGSTGEQTNPADEQVIADTGALDKDSGGGGIYEISTVIAASAASQFRIERRDAANSAVVGVSTYVYVPAGSTIQTFIVREALRGERFRVLMDDAQGAGTVAATIEASRIA